MTRHVSHLFSSSSSVGFSTCSQSNNNTNTLSLYLYSSQNSRGDCLSYSSPVQLTLIFIPIYFLPFSSFFPISFPTPPLLLPSPCPSLKKSPRLLPRPTLLHSDQSSISHLRSHSLAILTDAFPSPPTNRCRHFHLNILRIPTWFIARRVTAVRTP